MFKQKTLDEFPKSAKQLMALPAGVYDIKGRAFRFIKLATNFRYSWRWQDEGWWRDSSIYIEYGTHADAEAEMKKCYRILHARLNESASIDEGTTMPDCHSIMTYYKDKIKRFKNIQIGVELEVERDDGSWSDIDDVEGYDLVDEVGSDCSVRNGAEIRFNHPELKNWNFEQVAEILDQVKTNDYDNNWGTAGMHVHISGPNTLRAIQRVYNNLEEVKKILMPISCRREEIVTPSGVQSGLRYGIDGTDYIRDQFQDFGTLEIRAFESTTDPTTFEKRLRFCETFYKYLCGKYSLKDFFKRITKEEKDNYRDLVLDSNNPSAFGGSKEEILTMLA